MAFIGETHVKTVRVVLNLPEKVLQDLDNLAKERASKDRPLTRYQWLQSPNGQRWLRSLNASSNSGTAELKDVNKALRRAWAQDTGGAKSGRPGLHDHRVAVLADLLSYRSKAAA